MLRLLSSIVFLPFLSLSADGFGVRKGLQQHHPLRTSSTSTTNFYALPIDIHESVGISDIAHSLWVATIDSDIANIQLEEFRKVFAGGIAVMIGGLISTTLLGTIIEKKDLYANLAAESYIDMADDPNFWRQMTEGMSPEEQEKAKELMAKIKAQRAGEAGEQPLSMSSAVSEASGITESSSPPIDTAEDEAAKASNDMFSDY